MASKTVNLELAVLDGNAFSLMGAFQRQARKENWTEEEIDAVITKCKAGDYDHLLGVLIQHTEVKEEE